MATLGNIKWGVQIGSVDINGNNASKTISGLNLDDSDSFDSIENNAEIAELLATTLLSLTTMSKRQVSVIETRQVITNG